MATASKQILREDKEKNKGKGNYEIAGCISPRELWVVLSRVSVCGEMGYPALLHSTDMAN